MSLVNDVLRGIDDRRELPDNGLILTSTINKKETLITVPYQKILFLLIFILFVMLSIQLASNKSIFQLFSSDKNEYVVSAPAVLLDKPLTVREQTVVLDTLKNDDVISLVDINISDVVESTAPKTVIKAIQPSASIKSNLAIKKVKVAGNSQYQLAIKEYKQQRYVAALASIELAINESEDEKYQIFKARILLKQRNAIGFVNFIQQKSGNTSLKWFQLVAPGLQLLSYYEFSNKYYLQLIKQQPKNIQWPLAMAINYSKLNQKDRTYDIYQSLLRSSLLSQKQRIWISEQAQYLSQQLEQEEKS